MSTAVLVTDAGKAYVKAMGNSRGPHPLACEWVGTQLAHWFGLPTLDFAIMMLTEDDQIPLSDSGCTIAGPAFATRAVEDAASWSGLAKDLDKVENVDIITRLVVFDTLTLNRDRCPPAGDTWRQNPDNLLLTKEGAGKGMRRMLPIDHTECFSGGNDLNAQISSIDRTKDNRIFGLFGAFKEHLDRQFLRDAAGRLSEMDEDVAAGFVETIPKLWEITGEIGSALTELISRRAKFLADNIDGLLYPRHFTNLY